jgi:hypothetical protein
MKECPECKQGLVPSLQPDPNQGELFEIVELCKVPDEITGMALHSYLLDAGIQASLQDMHASFYGSVLSSLQGYWGAIIIPAEQEEKARKVLDRFWKEFNTGTPGR